MAIAAGGIAAAIGLGSAAYQVVSETRDRRRSPPPGRLVDVGGHRLHIMCAGEDSPAVVIIPAIGEYSAAWRKVQDGLAVHTAVCVYDRPGLGWSDPVAAWPSAAGMARDLHSLLETAQVAPPLVLAGHSMGGLVARMFAHMYPDEVAGLALVDSSHPEQNRRLPPGWLQDYPGGKLAEVALDFARPLGLRRLRQGQPGDAQAAFALSSRGRRADAKELLAMNAICRQTGRTARDLGKSAARGHLLQRARPRLFGGQPGPARPQPLLPGMDTAPERARGTVRRQRACCRCKRWASPEPR